MYIDAVCESYSDDDLDYQRHENTWLGRTVQIEERSNRSVVLASTIQKISENAAHRRNQIKPLGEGSYEIEVAKEPDGEASVSGSISYETDGGVKIEVEVKVDSDGNQSGSVSVGGKF